MPNNDLGSHVSTPTIMLKDIKEGRGDWRSVPSCVRETLLTILTNTSDTASGNVNQTERTLLPLRRCGPKVDITDTLNAICEDYRPPAMFVPNLHSVVKCLDEKVSQCRQKSTAATATSVVRSRGSPSRHNSGDNDDGSGSCRTWHEKQETCSVLEPCILPDRRVYYSSTAETHQDPSLKARKAALRRGGSNATSQKKIPRAVRPIAIDTPTIKKVDSIRHRSDVTNALLSVQSKIDSLHALVDTPFVKTVHDAMRLDPRRAKDVYGEVKPLQCPTQEQEEALAAFAESLAVLHEATRELLATFLSQEEKRYLGVDTHKFQTRAERSTTYQYMPSNGAKLKEQLVIAKFGEALTAPKPALNESNKNNNNDNDTDKKKRRVTGKLRGSKIGNGFPFVSAAGASDSANVVRTCNTHVSANPPSERPYKKTVTDPLLISSLNSSSEEVKEKIASKQLQKSEKRKTKVEEREAPRVSLQRKVSLSTLSTRSTLNEEEKINKKENVVEAKAAPVAPSATTATTSLIGIGKLDIKRFLIDSDSDSELN